MILQKASCKLQKRINEIKLLVLYLERTSFRWGTFLLQNYYYYIDNCTAICRSACRKNEQEKADGRHGSDSRSCRHIGRL